MSTDETSEPSGLPASGVEPPVADHAPGTDSPASPVEAAETAELEEAYKPKRSRWPALVGGAVAAVLLCVGSLVLVMKATASKGKPHTVVVDTPQSSKDDEYGAGSVSATPRSSTQMVTRGQDSGVVAASSQASHADPLPGVGTIASERPSTSEGAGTVELAVPTIASAGQGSGALSSGGGSSSGSSGSSNEYGDQGGALSGDFRSISGRPVSGSRGKDDKPEQYYEEITPSSLMVAKRRSDAQPSASSLRATEARARDPRIPARGAVLGGGRNADANEPFAPSNRLLKCELVFAVDSLSEGAPIIALTTQDFSFDGKLVVPKHTEVFGRVGKSYFETATIGRIVDGGVWRLVLPAQPGQRKGREIVLHGRALTRRELVSEPSGRVRQWDLGADGSPGLFGRAITTRDKAEVKKALLDILSGVVTKVGEAQKDKETTSSALGGITVGDAATMRNIGVDAATGGISGLLDSRSKQVAESIARTGTYVAVDSGAPFYLYVEEPILPADAQRGRAVVEAARSSTSGVGAAGAAAEQAGSPASLSAIMEKLKANAR